MGRRGGGGIKETKYHSSLSPPPRKETRKTRGYALSRKEFQEEIFQEYLIKVKGYSANKNRAKKKKKIALLKMKMKLGILRCKEEVFIPTKKKVVCTIPKTTLRLSLNISCCTCEPIIFTVIDLKNTTQTSRGD